MALHTLRVRRHAECDQLQRAQPSMRKTGKWKQKLTRRGLRRAGARADIFSASPAVFVFFTFQPFYARYACGVTPNVISFSALIPACGKAGKWKQNLNASYSLRWRDIFRSSCFSCSIDLERLAAQPFLEFMITGDIDIKSVLDACSRLEKFCFRHVVDVLTIPTFSSFRNFSVYFLSNEDPS